MKTERYELLSFDMKKNCHSYDCSAPVEVVLGVVVGPLGGVNGLGMRLLYTLAAMCYSAVLLSSSSFLLDFLGAGFSHSRLVSSLHVSTGEP